MKRALIILLLLHAYGFVSGQELKVLSIEERPIKSLLSTNDKYDLNGNLSAVVILSFQEPIRDLTFRGSIIDQTVKDEKTYILYVADITKRITIQHENYYPLLLDFRNNNIKIVGGHSYLARIGNTTSHVEETGTTDPKDVGSQYLIFRSQTKLNRLVVNEEDWKTDKSLYGYGGKKLVPFGTYRYEAESTDGKIINGEVKVKSKISSKVVTLVF